MPLPMPPRGVYFVTPEGADDATLLRLVDAALAGGAVLIQYRDKCTDASRRLRQARALRARCTRRGVPLVINDDVALAGAIDADGVHLGEHDAPLHAARAALGPGAIVGVSCYDALERAQASAAAGASYLAFGAFFPTRTKATTRRARPALLADAARFGLPRVAIGGLRADNAGPVIAAGADLIAVVGAIADAPDPRAATAQLASLFRTPS